MNDNKLKVVGIKTESEVLALIEKERQDMEAANREYKRENIRCLLMIAFICCVAVAIVYYIFKTTDMTLGVSIASLLLIFYIWANTGGDLYRLAKTDYSLPCQYYWLTKDKNVLYAKIKDNNVEFILEDTETHIVSEKALSRFNTAYRTDITNNVVDLDAKYIYFPYPTNKEELEVEVDVNEH